MTKVSKPEHSKMTGDNVSTRLQKEVNHLQHEMVKMRTDFLQWDTSLEGWLKDLKDELRGKLKVELQGLFEQHLGSIVNFFFHR